MPLWLVVEVFIVNSAASFVRITAEYASHNKVLDKNVKIHVPPMASSPNRNPPIPQKRSMNVKLSDIII